MGANALKPIGPESIPLVLDKLPPFPAVALRALNVLSGTETSLRDLCELIRPDPVFSAEILRIANSPLIAFPKEVTNVLQASMLLGFRRLQRLVVTVGLRSYVDGACTTLLRSCWRHSVACAILAEHVARWNSADRDLSYTAGILHDIGRVVLAATAPDSYSSWMENPASDGNVLECERDLFGIDHCQAGSRLANAWRLPEHFETICSHHHDPVSNMNTATDVIHWSCRLADALNFSVTPPAPDHHPSKVFAELPERIRVHLPQLEQISADIDQEISVIEGIRQE
jgi:putative nucleotidyltransferase with HDIG domain